MTSLSSFLYLLLTFHNHCVYLFLMIFLGIACTLLLVSSWDAIKLSTGQNYSKLIELFGVLLRGEAAGFTPSLVTVVVGIVIIQLILIHTRPTIEFMICAWNACHNNELWHSFPLYHPFELVTLFSKSSLLIHFIDSYFMSLYPCFKLFSWLSWAA